MLQSLSLAFCLLFIAWPGRGADLDLDAIMARHLKAQRGRHKLAYPAWRGHGVLEAQGGGASLPFTIEVVPPDRARFVFETGSTTIVTTVNGQAGWRLEPQESAQPQALSETQIARELRSVLYREALNRAYAAGKVHLLGRGGLDGRPVYVLQMAFPNGDFATYYVDGKSYLITKVREVWQIGRHRAEVVRIFADYRRVDGVPHPFSYEQSNSEGWRRFRLTELEVDPTIDSAVFDQLSESR